MTPRPNSASNDEFLHHMTPANDQINCKKNLNEICGKVSLSTEPLQPDDNSIPLEAEFKKSDKSLWKDLYRSRKLPRKGIKSPRNGMYSGRRARVVYLGLAQILSDEEREKLENGEILVIYR